MAADAIADRFVRRILEGLHPPGSRLTEREIVDVAGCSHAGARETLHHLEKAGAIRISRHRGAAVIGPNDAPATELTAAWTRLLGLLESLAGQTLPRPAGGSNRVARHQALSSALDRLGARAGDPRLAELLKRIALQRAIAGSAAG